MGGWCVRRARCERMGRRRRAARRPSPSSSRPPPRGVDRATRQPPLGAGPAASLDGPARSRRPSREGGGVFGRVAGRQAGDGLADPPQKGRRARAPPRAARRSAATRPGRRATRVGGRTGWRARREWRAVLARAARRRCAQRPPSGARQPGARNDGDGTTRCSPLLTARASRRRGRRRGRPRRRRKRCPSSRHGAASMEGRCCAPRLRCRQVAAAAGRDTARRASTRATRRFISPTIARACYPVIYSFLASSPLPPWTPGVGSGAVAWSRSGVVCGPTFNSTILIASTAHTARTREARLAQLVRAWY